jgi:nucleolar protein 9
MPKEHRKRGKKKKPEPEWQPPPTQAREPENVPPAESAGPSWIVGKPGNPEDEYNPEAPFGYVDVDVKAYFRTVDLQIRDWQDAATESQADNEDIDPNEGIYQKIKVNAAHI